MAETYFYVDPAATGLNNGSSWANAYTTLQAALNAVRYNGTRNIYARGSETLAAGLSVAYSGDSGSTYGRITVRGCDAAGTPGAGQYSISAGTVAGTVLNINGKTNYCWRNLTITGGSNTTTVVSTSASNASFHYFADCIFQNTASGAVVDCSGGMSNDMFVRCSFLNGATWGTITSSWTFFLGCYFAGNGSGAMQLPSYTTIQDCLLVGSLATPRVGTGINFVSGGSGSLVENCVIDGFATGVSFYTGRGNVVRRNRITRNTTGITSAETGSVFGNVEGKNYFSGNTTDVVASTCYSMGDSLLNQASTGYGTGFMVAPTASMRRDAVSMGDGVSYHYATSGLTAPDFTVVDPSFVLTGHDNYTGGSAGTLTLPTNTKVLNDQTYGVGGNGSTGTLTLPANGDNVVNGTTFGVAGNSIVGNLTLANTQYILSTAPDYGINGTGGAKTATIPTGANVQSSAAVFGINGTSETPSYPTTLVSKTEQLAEDTAEVSLNIASILKSVTILGITGTFDESARNTDPGEDNVIKDTNYKIQNSSKTGTFDESARNTDPGIANVIKDTNYKIQNSSKTGTFDESARNTDPGIANVIKDTNYKIQNSSKTGTFDESARNTDPGEDNVKSGTNYKIQNSSKTGTLSTSGGGATTIGSSVIRRLR